MKSVRLDKYLSVTLNISRNDSKKLLRQGVITVNGAITKKGDFDINLNSDVVCLSNKVLEFKSHLYIMQYKPKGVVSASISPSDVTVIDILPDELKRNGLFPAGRLDKDTTGFVLITDDGEFAHNILSPVKHVKKTYLVSVKNTIAEEDINRFENGLIIKNESFKPCQLTFKEYDSQNELFVYEIILFEGRYHQIKRMFASINNPVVLLKRIAIGDLYLDPNLPEGQSRQISNEELSLIKM